MGNDEGDIAMKRIIAQITESAKSQTDNPIMQQILIDFAIEQVKIAEAIMLKKIKNITPLEYQIMLIIEGFIQKEYQDIDIKEKTKKYQTILPKQIFCYLADYYLNTKRSKSKFSKWCKKYKILKQKGTYSNAIKMFLNMKQHGSVINLIQQSEMKLYTDIVFKDTIGTFINEINQTLRYIYHYE